MNAPRLAKREAGVDHGAERRDRGAVLVDGLEHDALLHDVLHLLFKQRDQLLLVGL